jgi:small subunit ribosomal protein S9
MSDQTPEDEQTPDRESEEPTAEAPAGEEPVSEEAAPAAKEPAAAEEPVAEEEPAVAEAPVAEEAAPAADEPPAAAEEPVAEAPAAEDEAPADEEPSAPREKPAIPGADLEVDIVVEGFDPLAALEEGEEGAEPAIEEEPEDVVADQPIATAAIDLAAGARYRATGKRKTAVARVMLKPGSGAYTINGKTLEDFFPRLTLQRNIRQPLETVGYEARMDVVARMHGGGVSSQAGALRHGISRALLEADPNLRGELKRRGFLTRDARAKERKKAGLKKARKRPQFSKR